MFDDIKGIVRRRKSKNVSEYNNQEKRVKIEKQCSAKEAQKSKKHDMHCTPTPLTHGLSSCAVVR